MDGFRLRRLRTVMEPKPGNSLEVGGENQGRTFGEERVEAHIAHPIRRSVRSNQSHQVHNIDTRSSMPGPCFCKSQDVPQISTEGRSPAQA
jgi:hypothetical protein